MRLSPEQQTLLKSAVRRHFGPAARLWVFGSRTDDTVRGGDFDLLVLCDDADADRLYSAKLAMLAELHATALFEGERIDLVLFSPQLDPTPRPVQRAAMTQGVELVL